jgi:hypothetical protein
LYVYECVYGCIPMYTKMSKSNAWFPYLYTKMSIYLSKMQNYSLN